jgi:molybdopterin synthase sulfur carrier subunit
MKPYIELKLFATLQTFAPAETGHYPIEPGMTVRKLLQQLKIPQEKARLIFINGVKANLSATLSGGERVGIFPPVGGG